MSSMQWFRLWHDMVTDPKWRVIARKSNSTVANVVAVAVTIMSSASGANERGLYSVLPEDVSATLDIDENETLAILEAMQGRFIDGQHIINWEKRQPKREDASSERTKAWRERKKQNCDAPVTQCDAPDKDTEKDKDTGKSRYPTLQKNNKTSTSPEVEVLKPKGLSDYRVQHALTDSGIEAARKAAPDWDIYYLMARFDEGVRSGGMERPRNADKALPAWCRKYTQGKRPA